MKNISKTLSYLLRHKPEEANLILDENGWIDINTLLNNLNNLKDRFNLSRDITVDDIFELVKTNDKQRFLISQDNIKIRANQGHSIDVDLNLQPITPPNILYHGSCESNLISIMNNGIHKMKRNHVHLSDNYKTAVNVGSRYGKPIVFIIDCKQMCNDGIEFYKSENGVYLVDFINKKYIRRYEKP